MPALLEARGLRASYGAGEVLHGIDFAVEEGGVTALLGANGAGKTTLLRAISGFNRPASGRIMLDGRDVTFLPPERRDTAMVFQSYALWPHMTVAQNVAFPLRVSRPKISRTQIRERVAESLALVGLESMADRPAPALSGGQQQRVALARALVREPKVLLLDEPLSNLDRQLRDRVLDEIQEIQQRLAITSVLVTHDHDEALAISAQVIVMRSGEVAEIGTPESIYSSPRSAFTAQFLGISNQLPGVVEDYVESKVRVRTELGPVLGLCAGEQLRRGDSAIVFMRPEKLRLSNRRSSLTDWRGTVQTVTYRGNTWDYRVSVGDHVLRVRAYQEKAGLRFGDEVFIEPEQDATLVLRAAGSHEVSEADAPAAIRAG